MPLADADVPEAGDIVWVEFGSPTGHEQAGRRPALVVSPLIYNRRSTLVIVCPITRNTGHWPFKVQMPQIGRLTGFILVDQIRSIDRHARYVQRAERVSTETLDQVYGMIATLFGIPVLP